MVDLLLGWFVIVAPFALSAIFILIPARSEHPQHHKRWRVALLVFGLLFSGISALQQHRSTKSAAASAQDGIAKTTANVKAEVERADARVINEQRQSITALSDALISKANESLTLNNAQFATTLQNLNKVLSETETSASLSARNLSAITGEDSHPCVVPDALAMAGTQVPFGIWNRGPNPLTGVEVSITTMLQYQEQRIAGKSNAVAIGTLTPEWPKSLPAVTPIAGKDEIAHFTAEIWTQNGFYTETINFRRARKGQQYWAFQYGLYKQELLDGLQRQTPKVIGRAMTARPILDCQHWAWSDE